MAMYLKRLAVRVRGSLVGLEHSRVFIAGKRYLDRYIAYCGGTLRLHRFHRGDDDRAPHDHPWPFVTFPFTSYIEKVFEPVVKWDLATDTISEIQVSRVRVVKAWRFHKRPVNFRHIVIGRADGGTKPFWTLVITSNVKRHWGFWPNADTFVPWREWADYNKGEGNADRS